MPSLIITLIFALLAVPAPSQDTTAHSLDSTTPPPPPPVVELSFNWELKNAQNVRAGDTVELDAVAEWIGLRDYYTLQVPQDPVCRKFQVAGKRTANRVEPAAAGGMRCRTVYAYFLEATEPGSGGIEGLTLLYTSLADGKERSLSVRGTEITIGPRKEKRSWGKIILSLALILVLAGAGAGYWFRRRARKNAGPERVSPRQALEERLQAANQAYNAGDLSEYYTQLLKILRDAVRHHPSSSLAEEAGRIQEKLEALRFSGAPLVPEEIETIKHLIKKLMASL
jgi:hypothetical protein